MRVAQCIYITIYCTSFYFLQNVIIDMKAMLSNAMKGDYLSKNNDSSVRFLSIYIYIYIYSLQIIISNGMALREISD